MALANCWSDYPTVSLGRSKRPMRRLMPKVFDAELPTARSCPKSATAARAVARSVWFFAALAWLAAPAMAQAPTTEWGSGCYAGGHVGGLWGEADGWVVETPGGDFFGQSLGGHNLNSWAGGIQGGCDAQFGEVIIGLGADYSWANARGDHPSRLETGVTYSSRIEGTGALTIRAGYALDRFLGYVRGGFAWQEESYEASTTMIGTAYTADETRVGWTLGLGGAYAISDALSIFVEYDYRDYGTETIDLTPQVAGLGPASVGITSRTSLVRAGVNLRFGVPLATTRGD